MDQEQEILSSEQVFDMLPHAVDIYEKINFDKFRKDIKKKYQGKKNLDLLDPVVDAAKYIMKNSGKIKKEVFTIVAIAENRPLDEVKRQPFLKTIKSFQKIFSDPDLVAFFKQAMQ